MVLPMEPDVPAIPTDSEAASDRIIREHVQASLVAAAVPVPLLDLAGLTLIRMRMVRHLARCYGQPMITLDRGVRGLTPVFVALADDALAIAVSFTGASGIGRSIAASVAKAIPVVGPAVGLAVNPAISGSVTYAMGRVIQHYLSKGGDLRDFDAKAARADLEAAVAEGQRYVAEQAQSAGEATEAPG